MKDQKEILLISKPLCSPWNDSGKNLVRDLVNNLKNITKYRLRILTSRNSDFTPSYVIAEHVYSSKGKYKPSFYQNFKVMMRLLKSDPNVEIYHFFFAPNPISCLASKIILKLKHKKSIQTILSSPKSYKNIKRLIFADKVIALSDFSKKRLTEKGIAHVVRIYPGIEISRNNHEDREQEDSLRMKLGILGKKTVLYGGDYEHGNAPLFIKESIPEVLKIIPDVKFIFACRLKTSQALIEEKKIKLEIDKAGLSNSIVFLNEVDAMHQLIRVCDLSILPVNSLYAKMDIPLILLESLREKKPIIISDIAPLNEILKDKAGECIQFGDPAQLANAIVKILSDDNLREMMGEKAWVVLEEYFNIKKIARQYDRVYSELID